MTEIPTYHVLAISGGGYRGLYSATILKELEHSFGTPLAKHFDLICGTSAGGLLALGLAKEIPAINLFNAFKDDGQTIFGRVGCLRTIAASIQILAKHSAAGLESVVTKLFGTATLGEIPHRVLIPSVNFKTGKGKFFKTPYHENFSTDHKLKIAEIALATAAAPTYFPLATNELGTFADGGLVGNSPGLFGYHEIKKFVHQKKETCVIRVLSVGTMTLHKNTEGLSEKRPFLDRGFFLYRAKLFDLMLSAQESSIDYVLQHILGDDYLRIDDQLDISKGKYYGALNDCSAIATKTLEEFGKTAATRILQDSRIEKFKTHFASPVRFFHGPQAEAQ